MEENNSLSFEQAIQELEQIVRQLETGDVPLEEAIDLFQKGMKLSQICSGKLEQAERKIEILIEEEAGLSKKPFQPSAEDKGD
ncbi:exodeoxyribonuclease VII small subunit [Marinicrinis lubricantis]|uniref:Exodeoxyribonuclease 7 small subunit n=1 Tax=Marinicrinis lubricantis TaxID=2086470 RepID=A0ABW1ISI8_9BACL